VLADIDRAVQLGAQAVTATPDGHPHQTARLSSLGFSYQRRFERGGVLADIDQAVDLGEQAVAATPDRDPHRAKFLCRLGIAYKLRFDEGGVPGDLDHAIENDERAVAATPEGHPDQAEPLSNLGAAYQARFERDGVLADINQAVQLGAQAVAAIPDSHPDRATFLFNLGLAYQARFDEGGVLRDLDQAIENDKQAVAATPDDHPHRARFLSVLGFAYQARFERRGVTSDLDQAVELGTQAVAAIPGSHPDRAKFLDSLSSAYRVRFQRSGVFAYIDEAVELGTQAVAAIANGDRERARLLSNLGVAYQLRFGRGEVLSDLDQAIENGEQALAAIPDGESKRAVVLFFRGGGVLADVLQVIKNDEPTRAATHGGRSRLAGVLSSLGMAYLVRFERRGVPADLDRAVELGWQALDATPNQALCMANLRHIHRTRFDHGGELDDLDFSLECGWRAVDATPNDHPHQATFLANLSLDYQKRLDVVGQGPDPQVLLNLTGRVTAVTTASPMGWVRAARAVGSLAHAVNEHNIAVDLLDAAVNMSPSVAPRESDWADQENRLGEHLGLAEETFAAHCAINDPVGAVEAAELGRGILLAAQLDSRSDLTELDRAHPDLAAEFRRVRDRLNTPDTTDRALTSVPIESVGRTEHRKRVWAEHDQLLTQIRQQTGFADFLLPPRLADLQSATAGGAAIVVNTGMRRSDAIIITADADPVSVPLPNATFTDVLFHAHAFHEAIQDRTLDGFLERQRVIRDALGWLWDAVVEPILKKMPPAADGTSTLRRVWWLPTGLLGQFPLHAAGHVGRPGALDTVVSSYIPTLRALAHARTRPPATVRRQLTVALQHTPGELDLPRTVVEATALHAQHPDTPLLLNEAATTSRVLAALPEATWAHFACHATADLTTPSSGGLVLHDATLALPDISQLHLGHAELAYLSACSTADRGVPLADESLHLASAFQLAGFRHVIASLWPLNDRIAATATDAFYQHLPDTPTADHAATALHDVVCELRDKHPDRPDLWAAHVHSGP
jgi:tetratricopeptide (TPR) repeat protein